MNKKHKAIAIVIIVYIISVFGSYTIFFKTSIGQSSSYKPPTVQNGVTTFDQNLPKTQPCPLNGELYSKQQEAWWQKHRPLGIMIENTPDARPQSGLNEADVTYEAVAEGGITRTFNEFYCQDVGIVGPVRSARTYFLDWASEYGDHPLYAHVGGANTPGPADALGQIQDYGWANNNLDQFSIGFPVFYRDYNRTGKDVATEHTMYSTTKGLWDYAAKNRNLTNVDDSGTSWNTGFVPYTFVNGTPTKGSAQKFHIEFWPSAGQDYFVDWSYDPKTNLYMRNNGGQPHMDKDTGKQLFASNVIVMYQEQNDVNDGYTDGTHLKYTDIGSGKAIVFQNGKQINATWSKTSRTDRTILTDANGNQIPFVRGKLWFEIVPIDIGSVKVE